MWRPTRRLPRDELNAAATAMVATLPEDPRRLNADHMLALGEMLSRIIAVRRECVERAEFFKSLSVDRAASLDDGSFSYLTKRERAELDASVGRALDADRASGTLSAWLRRDDVRETLEGLERASGVPLIEALYEDQITDEDRFDLRAHMRRMQRRLRSRRSPG